MISIKFTLTPRKNKKMNFSFFPPTLVLFFSCHSFFGVERHNLFKKMAIPEKNVFFDDHRRHTKNTKGKNEIQLSRTKPSSKPTHTHTQNSQCSITCHPVIICAVIESFMCVLCSKVVNSKLCDKGQHKRPTIHNLISSL